MTQLERRPKKTIEDELKKKERLLQLFFFKLKRPKEKMKEYLKKIKTTSKTNGRRPQKKGRQPQKQMEDEPTNQNQPNWL